MKLKIGNLRNMRCLNYKSSKEKSSYQKLQNYGTYHFSTKEWLIEGGKGIGSCIIIGILFYRSLAGILLSLFYMPFYIHGQKKKKINKQQKELLLEFQDGLHALAVTLEAGYSAEYAIKQSIKDLELLYSRDAVIVKEFNYMLRLIENNITIEKAFYQFGERSKLEDIQNFTEVFALAKRNGGNLIQMMQAASKLISEKIEVQNEIQTIITAKQYEASFMKKMPIFILIYLWMFSPEFISPLYGSLFGTFFMSFLLLIYCGLCQLMDRIVRISV